MKDLPLHVALFVFSGSIIVAVSCMFSEPDDRAAMRSFPRRWMRFFGGCLLVVAIMLACERFFASIR